MKRSATRQVRRRPRRQALQHGRSRQAEQRRLPVVRGVLLLAAVTTAALWLPSLLSGATALVAAPAWMQLRQVKVAGRFDHVAARELREVLSSYAGQSFFDVDVAHIRREIEHRPWVRSAAVRRIWPDGLRIEVREQQAVARWGRQGLVNEEGVVFMPERIDGDSAALPELDGPKGRSEALLGRMQEMNEILFPIDAAVLRLRQDARGAWQVLLSNDIELRLGRRDAVARLQRFVRFYPRLLLEASHIAEVDLRYSSGFVVRSERAGDERVG